MIRNLILALVLSAVVFFAPAGNFAQEEEKKGVSPADLSKSQEISEAEGIPVLVKHLPDWENKKREAIFMTDKNALVGALGNRSIFSEIDFVSGTEAVTANYPQGKLLIVEYTTPQASTDTDKKVSARLAQMNERIFYRRIGNYNVFLFDGTDEAAANALFDQIKYQKIVQWLGTNPNLYEQAGRYIAGTFSNVFISTVFAIVFGLGFSAVVGFFVGLLYFRYTDRRRRAMETFSDAGGMTRLNLDRLTPDMSRERLLKD